MRPQAGIELDPRLHERAWPKPSLDLNYGRPVNSEVHEFLLDSGMTREEYHFLLDNNLRHHCTQSVCPFVPVVLPSKYDEQMPILLFDIGLPPCSLADFRLASKEGWQASRRSIWMKIDAQRPSRRSWI